MTSETERQDDKAALLAELQHRVRNTLAVMRTIVRRSAETSESLDDYVMHLEGRLEALARVQSAFVRNPTDGIDLGLIISDELAAFRIREGERVTIDGPAVQLQPRAAETVQLAVHELATNALKFGALGQSSGRLAVAWRVEAGADVPRLTIEWVESGVAPVDTAPRHGFGRTVLEEILPNQLKAQTTLTFAPHGLSCRIDLPLTERVLKSM